MGSERDRAETAPLQPARWLLLYALGVLGFILAAVGLHVLVDPERRDLDAAARAEAPGAFVHLTDGHTHYEVGGPAAGQTVVLAAGASVPYYIWDPTFAALVREGFRVLRYDYFGRGYSDRPDVAYRQDLYVRQLVELLDTLHLTGPVDLAGLSFGGSVITSVADRYPERVRSLVYLDPAFRTPQAITILESMPRVWSAVTAVVSEPAWADRQLADFLHPERFPDWPARYRPQMHYRGFRRARLSDRVSNAAMDQRDEIARVGQHGRPVLVIWGRQDASVPFRSSEVLLRAMPRARLVGVDEAGHLPHWERPAVVEDALIGFLRRGGKVDASD